MFEYHANNYLGNLFGGSSSVNRASDRDCLLSIWLAADTSGVFDSPLLGTFWLGDGTGCR